jgi:hypothetical protein
VQVAQVQPWVEVVEQMVVLVALHQVVDQVEQVKLQLH